MIFAVYRQRLSLHMGVSFTSHCERGPTIPLPSIRHDDVAPSPGLAGIPDLPQAWEGRPTCTCRPSDGRHF